ncbi:MAG: RelA/SpoT family protein [Spirochaetaceae bacterium]|jgi:GTP pyrophosphokinase|nr:RelA/SpoT family protein [Spirochaetaceae bacterium]
MSHKSEYDQRRVDKALSLCSGGRGKEIAAIVDGMGLDADCIIAALLFDSRKLDSRKDEDLQKDIAGNFGEDAAALVVGAAKVSKLSAKDKSMAEAEKIRKMLFAMIEDIRVIFICLAEKLQDMRTITDFPEEDRKGIAQECIDIYAPLANRIGISWLKDEMEDLCLKQLNPDAYRQISSIVALKQNERESFLNFVKSQVYKETQKRGIKVDVTSRAKHFYSIYQKMRKRNKEAGDLYDLFGLRILCESVENCYTLLGMIHTLWKPIDGRFKDYIAMPKPNGYQSLHTTVLAFDENAQKTAGNLLEIQIRTFDMHHTAEYGYASHWLYKMGPAGAAADANEKNIRLVNRLKNIAGGFDDSALEEIKKEFLKDSILVFTPQGKVVELPQGATAIDFAYSIHTAIGEHCHAAKADGVIIPLSRPLRNTQIVEIITSQSAHPHPNWERIARTSKARGKIRAWLALNDEQREKTPPVKKKHEEQRVKEANPSAPEKHISEKTVSEKYITEKPVSEKHIAEKNAAYPISSRVLVQSEKNMLFRFAKCCNPKQGDEITGYVSRGRGIIIHRKNCPSLTHIAEFEQRRIDAEWEARNNEPPRGKPRGIL